MKALAEYVWDHREASRIAKHWDVSIDNAIRRPFIRETLHSMDRPAVFADL
jgi:hypothetical protein